ncbi:MAG: glucosamine-6-phosphate deaminase [Gammaproteobacteria bacterium]|nr:glucosamine-6-phosphate deaminase [Gammaproteobacteria bacterium]
MKVIILDNAEQVAGYGAKIFKQQLADNPQSVLGLATGSSPLILYRILIELYERGKVSFREVTTFNLDEYLGLSGDHPQSYRYFMNRNLFDHIDIDLANTFVPDGTTADPRAAAREYESKIAEAGGIDVQLLGIGYNGHIGFNEPSSSLGSRTRVKTLTARTIADNARFFGKDEYQPHLSITMGIGTILDAKNVVLLATGESKAAAVRNTIEGPISANCPASALQLHPATTIIVDQAAAAALDDPEFFKHIERENQKLQ